MLGTTVAVASVLALAGWSLYALVERSLVGEVDSTLIARARFLASTVDQQGEDLDVEFTDFAMAEFRPEERGAFLQLSLARGDVLCRSPSLGARTLELGVIEEGPTVRWIDMPAGSRGRQVTLPFRPELSEPVGTATEGASLALVLARDARDVDRALSTLRVLLVAVGLVTLAVAAAMLVWVVRRSVRPVAIVAKRISTIAEDDLAIQLEVADVPAELMPVVQRVNELLARLGIAFARERAFSDDVAHELRTPLAGLRTTLEVAATRRRDADEYAKTIRESTAIVGQLQDVVDRLLQLARLDSMRSATEAKPCDLAELIVATWEPFAERALSRGLQVDFRLEQPLEVELDQELLGLVLRNLHDNAVAYADEGGRVRIALRRLDERTVRIEVANSGSRIGPEEAASATQRFWRGDAARADTGLHCGLGLALVERATRALGGSLRLRSQTGGEFVAEVSLPADESA
ncbi:MAG: hypothetical protein K8S98_18905 [Planctomycetes bacterium]|nr:hypothetical protein [Planctomycetota bacterium]